MGNMLGFHAVVESVCVLRFFGIKVADPYQLNGVLTQSPGEK
jgi:hypothetical protein